MKYFTLLICVGLLILGCGSSKPEATAEQIQALNKLVESRSYEIVSDLAFPQNTSAMNSLQNSGILQPGSNVNQINLVGNVNYLRIQGDSIFAELPYFGERQMNVSYNGADSSIIIENVLQNYEVETKEKDNSILISFNAKAQTEILRFNITLYPNMKSSFFLNGPTRFPIRYTGFVKASE